MRTQITAYYAFALTLLQLALFSSAKAEEDASSASIPHSFDPICQSYVKDQKFISGDTTYWEKRVLPTFQSVLESPSLETEAKLNTKFKSMLSSYGFYEEEVSEYNSKRIISDCAKDDPNMNGKCFAMKAYCVRDFVKKELPLGIQRTIDCLKPYNQPYCGDSFQTPAGIQANLDTYGVVNKKIQEIEKKANSVRFGPEYLADVQTTFSDYSARVQQLMKDGKLALDEAKKKEAAKITADYEKDKKQVANLGDAAKAFSECQKYLNEEGLPDNRAIVDQVASCALDTDAVSTKDMTEFKKVMSTLKCSMGTFRKKDTADLVSKAYLESLASAASQYLTGYYAINGSLPPKTTFCKKIGGCPKEISSIYDEIVKTKDSLPKLDRKKQSDTFNQFVRTLNSKCASAAQSMANGTSRNKDLLNPINTAYADLIYKSGFGNLMGIGHFKDAVGEFDQEGCLEDGEGLKEIDPNGQALKDALDESVQILADKAKGLQAEKATILDKNDPYPGLRYFLEFDPLTLREILRKTNDGGMATLMCLEIEKIYKDEKNHRTVSMALAALSVAGAVVATVLSGGAASPLLVAAIGGASIAIGVGSGTYNYMAAKSQETHYQQSTVAGSFDQQIGQDLMKQYHFEGNAELVGIAASFAPGVGKGLVYAGEKTGVNLMIRTEAELMKDAIKSAPLFEKAAQYSKPITEVFSKVGAGKAVALTEIQAGLASKVGPKTAKAMISTFNAMTKDMGYNASMVFAVHALTHPDPYSEQGILDCLESLAMAQGMTAVGTAGRNYLLQKRPGLFSSGAMNHFDFDEKIAKTTDGFEQANLMRQKEAFEKFKKDVNFESMKPSEKRAFMDRLYEAHKKGEITEKGKPNGEKAAALSGIRDEIKAGLLRDNPGMSEAEAKKRALQILDGITNEDIALLGLKQKAKSVYEGPKGKVQESNKEASTYIKPEDSKRIGEIFSRQDLTSNEKASQAFDVAFEARIRELPLSDQKMLKDALAKAKFKVGTKVSNSGMTLKGPQDYFESVSYYKTLMGEMEGQIQLKVKTNPSLRRAYQRYLSAPGKFLYALEEGAMRSEWSFLNSIPKDSKEAIITEVGGWKLSTAEKDKLIASLRNSDLTVEEYLKNQRGLFGEGSKFQTAVKANFSAKGILPYATKNLIWWKVCENIFTDDYAGQTDEAIEKSKVYKNICKFAAIPALVR